MPAQPDRSFVPHLMLLVLILSLLAGCQTPERLDPSACKKIVILPPESFDEKASDYVIETWRKLATGKKLLRPCDVIIDMKKAKATFKFMNISHSSPVGAGQLSTRQRSTLLTSFQATHLLSLDFTYSFDTLTIRPQLFELLSNMPDHGALRQKLIAKNVEDKVFDIPFSRWLKLGLISLVPTSFVGGFSQSTFANALADGSVGAPLQELERESQDIIPPLLSSFRFENLLHRDGYNLFDFGFRFIPYMNFSVVNNHYVYTTQEEYAKFQANPAYAVSRQDYSLKYYSGSANIMGDLSLYLPIGTIFFSLGAGLVLYNYEDSLGNSETGLTPAPIFRFGYRIFFDQRWFVQLVGETQIYEGIVDNELFKSDSDNYAIFGIGYFYPEIQEKAAKKFLD